MMLARTLSDVFREQSNYYSYEYQHIHIAHKVRVDHQNQSTNQRHNGFLFTTINKITQAYSRKNYTPEQ